MRKRLAIVIITLLITVTSLAATGCGSAQSSAKEPYKIGILTTLSGPVAYLGTDVRNTAQMEVDRINAAGGINGHPLELVAQDDGGNPTAAATGFIKLVRQDHVLAVTGTVLGLEPALRPLAERDHIPYVLTTNTLPDMRARHDKYTFALGPNEFVEAAAWFNILKHDGYTRVAALGENDTNSPVLLGELKKEAPAHGITVYILPDPVNVNAVDVTPQVAKLKQLVTQYHLQALVSGVWPPQLPALLKTMKQLGVNIPVICHYYVADNSILHMAGNEINGLVMPGVKVLAGSALPNSDPQKPVVVAFKKRYEAKFHQTPGFYASITHDAIHLIADALKVSGPNQVKLRDALENTKNYVGVIGVYNFSPTDHEGLSSNCLVIYTIKNHKFVFLREVG